MNLCQRISTLSLALAMAAATGVCFGQAAADQAPAIDKNFAPLTQWKRMVQFRDTAGLKTIYSSDPPAQVTTPSGPADALADIKYWVALRVRKIELDLTQSTSPQPGVQQVAFQAEFVSAQTTPPQTLYVRVEQGWQKQGERWELVSVKRSEATRLQQPPANSKDIYSESADARAEIKEALGKAATEHKRVILVFGANWCYDCHVLDLAFHRPDLAPVLATNFEVVHVDVGKGDKNQDLTKKYQVPTKRGIPALAVLDSSGKLVYSQQKGEFEKARALAPEDLLAFLNKWKPAEPSR